MTKERNPSGSDNPDLDWSQIRETVLMLNLAVSHIEHAMKEGDDSVTSLAKLFSSIMEILQTTNEVAKHLSDGASKDMIMENFHEASGKMRSAIVAFQFYDKLAQRLTHVSQSLASLVTLVGDPGRIYQPSEWDSLQGLIKSKYTIEADRKMFEALRNGATVDEALQQATENEKNVEEHDVELF